MSTGSTGPQPTQQQLDALSGNYEPNFGNYTPPPLASCPAAVQPSPPLAANDAATIGQAIGATTCTTTSTSSSSAGGFVPLGIGAGSTSTTTTQVGCNTIQIVANNYRNIQANINCIIQQSSNIQTVLTNTLNQVLIENTGPGTLNIQCGSGGLNITQGTNVTSISSFNLSESDTAAVTNQVQSLVSSTAQLLSSDTSGLEATTQGSQSVSQQLSDIQSMNVSEQVKQAISQVQIASNGTNSVTISNSGSGTLIIGGNACIIDQQVILNVASSMIINSVLNTVFSGVISQTATTAATNNTSQAGSGASNATDGLWSALDSVETMFTSITFYLVVGGVLILCVLGYFGSKVLSTEGGQEALVNASQSIGKGGKFKFGGKHKPPKSKKSCSSSPSISFV